MNNTQSYRRAFKTVSYLLVFNVLVVCLIMAGQDVLANQDGVIIEVGQGIVFEQVDFTFPEATMADSAWGRVEADGDMLFKHTGMSRGYLNVHTDVGWVVDNLLVTAEDSGNITAYFSLGLTSPADVTVLSAYVMFSSSPVSVFSDGTRSDFPVGTAFWNAQGAGDEPVTEIGPPPPPRYIIILNSLDSLSEGEECLQSEAENVQTAVNQCAPMAIANSLQFLENTTGIDVPHDHDIGLRGDDTLVGMLDETMDRSVTDRSSGNGVWFVPMLEGKFEYLVDNGLEDALDQKHQGRGYEQLVPDGDFTHMGVTSIDQGDTVTWEFICDEVCAGEDVELIYKHSTGGHAVRVTGCGITEGKKWIRYTHDSLQSNDTAGLETVQVNLEDLDSDGTLNLGSMSREVVFILSESVLNYPPDCDADGPYTAECDGASTLLTLDGTGSSDPDGDALTFSWSTNCPGGSFLDATNPMPELTVDTSSGAGLVCEAGLEVADSFGASDSCSSSVTITDTIPPDIHCNSPATIVPPDAPVSFTATATDICDVVAAVEITGYDCFKFTKKGKRIDKTGSCIVEVDGDTITVVDSGGVDDNISWSIRASDNSGNVEESVCSLVVVNPGQN